MLTPIWQLALGATAMIVTFSAAGRALDRWHGRRRPPLSERGCRTLLRLAAWLERTGLAWDSAIVRYRMEAEAAEIRMESTRRREAVERG